MLTILVLLPHFPGCMQPTEEESSLHWAHLPYQSSGGSNWLVNVPPNTTIEVCGSEIQHGVRAIKQWAEAIGRVQYLKVIECGTGSATVKVNISRQQCGGIAFAKPYQREVYLCNEITQWPLYYVILHEVGHLWGLCDLYSPAYSNCDPNNNTGVPEDAVMLAGSSRNMTETLKQDDLDGIKALAERTDIPGNQVWKDFLQNPTPTTPDGTTPTTPADPNALQKDLFMALRDQVTDKTAEVFLSSPTTITRTALCLGDYQTCVQSQFVSIAFTPDQQINGRQIYKTSNRVVLSNGQIYTLLGWDQSNQLKAAVAIDVWSK